MAAERSRREAQLRDAAPQGAEAARLADEDDAVARAIEHERNAESRALAQAALAENARGVAAARSAQDEALAESVRRRIAAEELAAEAARQRTAAEEAAETALADRLHAERLAEGAARERKEAEERALIDARRNEMAAASARDVVERRVRLEEKAASDAREAAAAHRRAGDLAAEKTRLSQAGEAAAMARTAAERDSQLLAARRNQLEQEAASVLHASAQTDGAFAAESDAPSIRVGLPEKPPMAAKQKTKEPAARAYRLSMVVALLIGITVGVGLMRIGSEWLTASSAVRYATESPAPLKLDAEFRSLNNPPKQIPRNNR